MLTYNGLPVFLNSTELSHLIFSSTLYYVFTMKYILFGFYTHKDISLDRRSNIFPLRHLFNLQRTSFLYFQGGTADMVNYLVFKK